MANKQPAGRSSAASPVAANHPDTYLGTPWAPDPPPMPDPPPPLTERGDENTLLAPAQWEGLGFSRYVTG
jgi:hypothetical protein